nr:MAG TPA: hypothetical protein [Caudoviricetes sp.]
MKWSLFNKFNTAARPCGTMTAASSDFATFHD